MTHCCVWIAQQPESRTAFQSAVSRTACWFASTASRDSFVHTAMWPHGMRVILLCAFLLVQSTGVTATNTSTADALTFKTKKIRNDDTSHSRELTSVATKMWTTTPTTNIKINDTTANVSLTTETHGVRRFIIIVVVLDCVVIAGIITHAIVLLKLRRVIVSVDDTKASIQSGEESQVENQTRAPSGIYQGLYASMMEDEQPGGNTEYEELTSLNI